MAYIHRVELTVNLPKLEPFIPEEKECWSVSPTPVPPRPLRKSYESTPLLHDKPRSAKEAVRLSTPMILVEHTCNDRNHAPCMMDREGEERERTASPQSENSDQLQFTGSTNFDELPGEAHHL